MFWFYLAQWFFIFEHYKASIYIEKRLELSDEELENHSETDLKLWAKYNVSYCLLLTFLSVIAFLVQLNHS